MATEQASFCSAACSTPMCLLMSGVILLQKVSACVVTPRIQNLRPPPMLDVVAALHVLLEKHSKKIKHSIITLASLVVWQRLILIDTGSTCYHVATQLLHVGLLFSRMQQALTSKVVHSLLFHQTVLLACFSTMSMRECTYELWHDKAVVVWCRQLLDSKRLL